MTLAAIYVSGLALTFVVLTGLRRAPGLIDVIGAVLWPVTIAQIIWIWARNKRP